MSTTEIENFPGFPEGITGPELMDRMRRQAVRWGATTAVEDVESVDLSQRPFVVKGTDTTIRAHSIIVATGATAKRLGIPNEDRFWSSGISACAICDGASPIFKNQEVAVVGGGDTACEEAVYLTKYAKHVHLLVRGDKLRASKAMQERTMDHKNITIHFNTSIIDALPDVKGRMGSLKLSVNNDGTEKDLPVRGLFYGIGHKPNSDFLGDQIRADEAGYVVVNDKMETSVPGVFAAGDLHDTAWRQAVTAAGAGCAAALAAERYLSENGLEGSLTTGEEGGSSRRAGTASDAAPTVSVDEDKASPEEQFDPTSRRHKGQYALRKLYHESDKVLAVLYSSPSCGPCRALKPMFSKVVDDMDGDLVYVEIDIV